MAFCGPKIFSLSTHINVNEAQFYSEFSFNNKVLLNFHICTIILNQLIPGIYCINDSSQTRIKVGEA